MKAKDLGLENRDIVVYKGKAYYGRLVKDKLIIKPIKRELFSNKEKELKFDKLAIMNKHVYDLFIKNTKEGRVETSGVIGGRINKNKINISYILNFLPPKKAPKGIHGKVSSVSGGGYGAEIANEEVNQLVKKRGDIIGFYHSHPTRDTLSPADKKELREASKFSNLKEPAKFHILCRRSGLHRAMSKYVLLPLAFYKSVTGKYKQIPVLITEKN